MICNHPLTAEDRALSRRNYNLHCFLNGGSYICLGETVITLFAIKLAAPNAVIAAIGAMFSFGFLMLPLGVMRTARVGAAESISDCWVMRSLSALLVAIGALVYPLSAWGAWALLLLGSFFFYGFRAAGVVMGQPLVGEFTTDDDRQKLLGDATALFNVFGAAMLVSITLLLRWNDSIWVLVAVITVGACLGIVSTVFLRRIRENAALRDSVRKPIMPQLRQCVHTSVLRRQIYANFMFNICRILLFSMGIATLKRAFDFTDSSAMMFTIIQMVSSAMASKILPHLARHYNTRTLIILGYFLMLPVCVFWMAMPAVPAQSWSRILFIVPFMLNGAVDIMLTNSLTQYFLQTVGAKTRVAGAMFISIVTGVPASLAAMALAGFLFKWAESHYSSGILVYKAYFTLCLIVLLLGSWIMFRLKKTADKQNGLSVQDKSTDG